jgi:transposase
MKKREEKEAADPKKAKQKFKQGLPVINEHAAGIDVGDTFHAIAFSNREGNLEVRESLSFTTDLNELVKLLKEEGITTAAMESTGVYWLNLYLMLEESGIEPYLVNARHVKNVTGRKKDDTDAMWLQKLHSCGLLQKSFQPDAEIRILRTYVRQRKNLIRLGSDSTRRMQKALELMNLKIHVVISDILGKTGMALVAAIIGGQRDANELIKLKDPRIKASDEEIKKSLEGIWKDEYLFMLQQAYDGYLFYQFQIQSCDEKIKEQLLRGAAKILEGNISDMDITIKKKPKKNQFNFNAEILLSTMLGVNVCEVNGLNEVSVVELISEIGTDMTKWKSHKHLAAWLNVVPNTKITGGKIISSKMQKKKNIAGQTLRMSASSLSASQSPLGNYYRKMKSRLGKKGGVVATAHKMARIVYAMLSTKQPYNESTMENEQEKWKKQRIKHLENQLSKLKHAS